MSPYGADSILGGLTSYAWRLVHATNTSLQNIMLWSVKCSAIISCWSRCTRCLFCLFDKNCFHVKEETENLLQRCRVQIWKFHIIVWQTTSKNCTRERDPRLFFLIQPIISFICGVAVALAIAEIRIFGFLARISSPPSNFHHRVSCRKGRSHILCLHGLLC